MAGHLQSNSSKDTFEADLVMGTTSVTACQADRYRGRISEFFEKE